MERLEKVWSYTKRLFSYPSTLRDYIRYDTWNGFKEITLCKIFGHKPDYENIGDLDQEQDIWCKQCKTYLKTLSHKEHIQKIRELKLKRILKNEKN